MSSTQNPANATDRRVTRNDEAGRYEIWIGDTLGGFTTIEPDDNGRLVFPHTEIDPAFKREGLGSILVGEALADAAKRGETIVPVCRFVQKYLRENDVPGAVIDWPRGADPQNAATPGEQPA